MAVTHELLETFTGKRTQEMPDPDNDGKTLSEKVDCRDIKVKFTCSDTSIVHERSVNVCFDAEGAYDAAATLIRVGEVGNGVANKIAVGTITA